MIKCKNADQSNADTVKPGDILIADAGFTCLKEGRPLVVQEDPTKVGERISRLYVQCNDGRHYLDGQLGEESALIGFYFA